MKGVCCSGTREFCPALAAQCSRRPSSKYFFFTVPYFNSSVPIAQQAGQAVVLGRLSLSMCLWEILACNLQRERALLREEESNAKLIEKIGSV